MSEAGLWLNYGFSAVIALLAVYRGWRIVPAIFVAAIVAVTIWLAWSLAGGGTLSDPGLGPALIANASFSVIFAGAGAAAGYTLRNRKRG